MCNYLLQNISFKRSEDKKRIYIDKHEQNVASFKAILVVAVIMLSLSGGFVDCPVRRPREK